MWGRTTHHVGAAGSETPAIQVQIVCIQFVSFLRLREGADRTGSCFVVPGFVFTRLVESAVRTFEPGMEAPWAHTVEQPPSIDCRWDLTFTPMRLHSLPIVPRWESPLTKMQSPPDLLPGTLDLLVLKTLAHREMHGYGIAQHLKAVSGDVLQVGESSLYPALQRLLLNGWVKAEWGASENNRRARYYTLTPSGRKRLAEERQEFNRLVTAIQQVLAT